MMNTGRASNIQGQIKSLANGDANSLIQVPVDTKDPREAARILQVQVFALADAVADLSKTVEKLSRPR